jgi:NADPH-dependent 2,4-dienoyl-CoA reductase/sulfur reductase-like enzyme
VVDVFDLVIVGAGPAGLEAARSAFAPGRRIAVVDDNPRPGGQIWRHDPTQDPPRAFRSLWDHLDSSGTRFLCSHRLVAFESGPTLVLESPTGTRRIRGERLLFACGARELFLPFPGWTLPGVYGAGGLQALAKGGLPVAGRTVVLAGSGPLLLASAVTLLRHGARVEAIIEQAPTGEVARFLALLPRWPLQTLAALALIRRLIRVPYWRGVWVSGARGRDRLCEVEVTDGRTNRILPCEALGTGYGLVPNIEAPNLLGCKLTGSLHPAVAVDSQGETSLPGIYAAGEVTGIGGVGRARLQGALAGVAAMGETQRIHGLLGRARHANAYVGHLAQHFRLREPVRRLAGPATVVCRCEDAALGPAHGTSPVDPRALRLLTRIGMGHCQGRICLHALAETRPEPFLREWLARPRPPLFPTRLETLAGLGDGTNPVPPT